MINKPISIPKNINIERFFAKISVDQSNGCWNWNACRLSSGYGKYLKFLSHRVSYSIFNGDIYSSLVIDHICKNRSCVNPDHLRQVTQKQNTIENSNSVAAVNIVKTHCINGHEFTPENITNRKYGRECRVCANERQSISQKNKRKENRKNGLVGVRKYCRNGHLWSSENVKKRGRGDVCYICYLARAKRYYERIKKL